MNLAKRNAGASINEPSINTQIDLKYQPLKYLKWRISALHKKEMNDLINLGTGHTNKPVVFDENMGIPKGAVNEGTSFS